MAESARQSAFDREFRRHIERLTPALVSALRRITATTPPAEVKVLAFEIEPDWREFPVYLHAMDDVFPNEVYFRPPFHGGLLRDAGELIPEGAIDQEAYEEAGVGTFESGARVLAVWFGECWHEAGGSTFPLPAYISLHDSTRYYDLRAHRWVRESNIWS
jgi:hypothetical protein